MAGLEAMIGGAAAEARELCRLGNSGPGRSQGLLARAVVVVQPKEWPPPCCSRRLRALPAGGARATPPSRGRTTAAAPTDVAHPAALLLPAGPCACGL